MHGNLQATSHTTGFGLFGLHQVQRLTCKSMLLSQEQLSLTQHQLQDRGEVQMAYDKLCQDMYRMRMQLAEVTEQRGEVVEDAQEQVKQLKRDMAWLIRDFQQRVSCVGEFEAGKGVLWRVGRVPGGVGPQRRGFGRKEAGG